MKKYEVNSYSLQMFALNIYSYSELIVPVSKVKKCMVMKELIVLMGVVMYVQNISATMF